MNKVKIAATTWMFGTGGTAQALAEQAEMAEQLGFHSFWLPESHFIGQSSIPAPLMLLAAMASRTSRIKLGTTSYILPIRHPIQAAEDVAVLDRLSNGRLILGVGRGFREALFTTFDVPVKEKRKRFVASLEIMINAWKGEAVAWQEKADEPPQPVYLAPLPIQQPHPPIWAAAFGPLALNQIGSLGLPYLASPLETESELITNYETHQKALVAANHNLLETMPIMRTVFISRNSTMINQVRKILKQEPRRSQNKENREVDIDEWALIGEPNFVADKIIRYQEKLGMTHMIARTRFNDIPQKDLIQSMEYLAEMH